MFSDEYLKYIVAIRLSEKEEYPEFILLIYLLLVYEELEFNSFTSVVGSSGYEYLRRSGTVTYTR